MPVSVAARIFIRSSIGSLAMASRLPDSTVLNGSTFASSGFCSHQRRHTLQAVDDLRVHRVFDPQGAVLVEGGDARLRGTKLRARSIVVRPARSSMIVCFAGPSFQDGSGSRLSPAGRDGGSDRRRQARRRGQHGPRGNAGATEMHGSSMGLSFLQDQSQCCSSSMSSCAEYGRPDWDAR